MLKLLARELNRAHEIAAYEARVRQSIIEAQRVQAIVEQDALPEASGDSEFVARSSGLGSMLCGGEAREIISAQCFPNKAARGNNKCLTRQVSSTSM